MFSRTILSVVLNSFSNKTKPSFPDDDDDDDDDDDKRDVIKPNEAASPEAAKLELKGACEYAVSLLLEEDDLVTKESPVTITPSIQEIGKEIRRLIVRMTKEKRIVKDEELIGLNESDEDNAYEEILGSEDEDYGQSEERRKLFDFILSGTNVKLKPLNPRTINLLKSFGIKNVPELRTRAELTKWEIDLRTDNRSIFDMVDFIDASVYHRFDEARQNGQVVTRRNLQEWSLDNARKLKFNDFNFEASRLWVEHFKKKYRIRHREVVRYVSEMDDDPVKSDETLEISNDT